MIRKKYGNWKLSTVKNLPKYRKLRGKRTIVYNVILKITFERFITGWAYIQMLDYIIEI